MRPVLEMVNKDVRDDYEKVVKHPMDLGSILKKLRDGLYQTACDVRMDVSTVWRNCQLYNSLKDDIYK